MPELDLEQEVTAMKLMVQQLHSELQNAANYIQNLESRIPVDGGRAVEESPQIVEQDALPDGAAGDLLYWDDTDKRWKVLNIGDSDDVLRVISGEPQWDPLADMPDELSDLLSGTNTNDIIYYDASGGGSWNVLAAPSTSGSFYLKVESGTLQWKAAGRC